MSHQARLKRKEEQRLARRKLKPEDRQAQRKKDRAQRDINFPKVRGTRTDVKSTITETEGKTKLLSAIDTRGNVTLRRKETDRKSSGATGSFEEKPGGLSNVLDVLKAPFQKDVSVEADINNKRYKFAAEYVANHPFVTASILTGIGGAVRGAVGIGKGILLRRKLVGAAKRFVIGGKPSADAIAGAKIIANTKTATLTARLISSEMAKKSLKVATYAAIAGTIGTYPWAEWALGEAKEGMIFNTQKAINTGDAQVLLEYLQTSDEIFDITTWENIQRLIPYANIAFAFGQKAKALEAQWKVNNKIIQDELSAIEDGTVDDFEARTTRMREEEAAMDTAAIEEFNEARKVAFQFEQDALKAAREAKRKDEKKARNEDAAFWRKERAEQRKREEEDRKAIGDFWIAYRKTINEINLNNRPSNLNFGLL